MLRRARVLAVLKGNTNTRVRGLWILVVWLIGLSLSSCDSGLPSATITAEEFRFTPKLVKLPAGQHVRLIVRNQGRERHVFKSPILAFDDVRVDRNSLGGAWQGGSEISIPPGKRIELSLVMPEGLYPFRCQVRGHKGMEGTLVVEN